MNINLKWGDRSFNATLEPAQVAQVIESNPYTVDKTEEEMIQAALARPLASARLRELVHPGETVCVVIPDSTRAWQKVAAYLPHVIKELNDGGIKDTDITIISATGTHRTQTREEHAMLLGPELAGRFQVIDHESQDEANLVYMGMTTWGTPVWLNKKAMVCDHLVLTGGIVYHFLAGWGGGPKYVLPGIAGYETVMKNHAWSLSPEIGAGTDPRIRSGYVRNNPIHLDMMEAASFAKPSFMFNVIMGPDGNIAGAVAGNLVAAHAAGRELVDEIDGVVIREKADLVVASAGGFPKDINLYQSIKTVINAREAAKPGGVIIILAECREGIGGTSDVQDIILHYDTLLAREQELRANYSISKFVGYYMCETAAKYTLIYVTTLDPALLKKANMVAVRTLEEALTIAYGKIKGDARIHVMPHGANTLPKLD
ncbi:Hypothetical protein LUCI_2301 [Lucifera butyrica]|uniref:Uncharacterized protein n=1 Tax=Lucifera butyrica TaxID=1351585 RepID=A0A498R819_9FIRM|nr:nickel-dependent lactate racemase [Lucifera butyrica]VBB07057.1 Hypothetical protein LUCI_2301 [Lucifera butyrica]